MNGEDAVPVGGARRAIAELTEPTGGLVADFVAAEDGAATFDPELLLLDVDLFGGITLPAGAAARGQDRSRTRRAPSPPERLAAARPSSPVESAVTTPTGDAAEAGAAGAAAPRRTEAPLPAGPATTAPPVFRLADRAAPATSPEGSVAGASSSESPAVTEAESGGSSASPATTAATVGAGLRGSAPAEAAEGAVALIAELTASILAAGVGAGATAGATSATDRVTDAERRRAAEPPERGDPGSAFLEETVRSLGSDTAAALGLELEAPGARPAAEPGAPTAGDAGAPARAPGSPASARPASPELLAAVQPPAGAGSAGAARTGEVETDPTALAALVNEVLVEQARRHGLELG